VKERTKTMRKELWDCVGKGNHPIDGEVWQSKRLCENAIRGHREGKRKKDKRVSLRTPTRLRRGSYP